MRVVAEGATLGLYEARRGLFPMGGSAVRLPRQIPYTFAMDILLTGRSVTPEEALRHRPDQPGRAGRRRR